MITNQTPSHLGNIGPRRRSRLEVLKIWPGISGFGIEIGQDVTALLLFLTPAVDDHRDGRLVLPDAVLDEALVHATVGLGRVRHVESAIRHDFDAGVAFVIPVHGKSVVDPRHLRDRSTGRLEVGESL